MTAANTTQQTPERRTLSDVKSDARDVREDLTHLKDDAVAVGSEAAGQAIEHLKSGAEGATDLAQTAGEQAKAAHATMRKKIVENPTSAVLVALGVGAIERPRREQRHRERAPPTSASAQPHRSPTIHHDRLPRDEARAGRTQERRRGAEFLRLTEASDGDRR